jgi:glutamyl-tRNA synthetase
MLRFAPSPTGLLHIGNLRVALLNYLFAKKNNIKFFLRIDDTDLERSSQKYTESIISDLEWLDIDYFDIFKQSERMNKYIDVFNFLKKKEFIYPCFESAEELSLKRKILLKQGKPPIYDRSSLKLKKSEISSLISSGKKPHWRLKLNDELINWEDQIHNKVIFKNLSISDPVIFRSDELPLFTITSVVDDVDLNVTHIMRGDDHLTNTAAQIQLFKSSVIFH